MGRRYNAYFVTAKWVFDRAARTRNVKATTALEHAKDHLLKRRSSWPEEDAFGLDPLPEVEEALRVLDAAVVRAHQAHEEAQATAAKSQGRYTEYLQSMRRAR